MRMIQSGNSFHLALETSLGILITLNTRRKNFYGYLPMYMRIAPKPDLTHASTPYLFKQLIAPKAPAYLFREMCHFLIHHDFSCIYLYISIITYHSIFAYLLGIFAKVYK